MKAYIADISDAAMRDIRLSGGKGASLNRLSGVESINVPGGFIITTDFFSDFILPIAMAAGSVGGVGHFGNNAAGAGGVNGVVGAEAAINIENMRTAVVKTPLPDEARKIIHAAYAGLGEDIPVAVRSSATAEDLPGASFAGQQDSFLNVTGASAVAEAVSACMASIYNERAVSYRVKQGIDEGGVRMAVVVQRMTEAEAAGVMFTADPVSSDRFTTVIEAVKGLGDELVSGKKTPATYNIKDGIITMKNMGGAVAENSVLTDAQIRELVKIGGQIEHEYGNPQDIEWAFESGTFHILQSRGITTLYPPPPSPDGFKRCFISVGHMQVMTETILPLGMSFWGMMSEDVKIIKVGGRIYMEITHNLTSAAGKAVVRQKVSNSDVLMDDAINRVLTRKDYIKSIPKGKASNFAVPKTIIPALISGWSTYRANNPDMIKRYNKRLENNIEKSRSALDKLSGKAVLEFICEDMKSLMKDLLDPEGLGPLLVAFFMTKTLDRAGKELLNRDVVSGVVSKWLLVNITSEMGNGVSRIAGAARDYPEVIGYLENAGDAFELKTLRSIPGGEASAAEFELFFERFGMRCPGEIDITKPRFVEEPSKILSAVLADIKLPKGHASEKFENGKRESDAAVSELIAVAKVKWGAAKARKLEKQLSFYRNFLGLRESPKYFWMKRYWVYRQAIMRVAYDLAREGKIRRAGDIDYLDIDELIGLCEGRFTPDYEKIDALRKDYAHWATLTPPRLIFSDGEVVNGEYTRDIPEGALAGVAVSNGVAEGRARVILDIKDAHMIEEGDILVTRYTDPSWTPAFMSIGGLVTETGGMATHGAIITREYGLPCVVGVVNASRLIRDGQRIRINGDEGYAEIL